MSVNPLYFYKTTAKDMQFIWHCMKYGMDGKTDFQSRYVYFKVLCRAKLGGARC